MHTAAFIMFQRRQRTALSMRKARREISLASQRREPAAFRINPKCAALKERYRRPTAKTANSEPMIANHMGNSL